MAHSMAFPRDWRAPVVDSLPENLYTASQVRSLDDLAIREQGIPGLILMKRAGRALLVSAQAHWADINQLAIFCGSGNNGGDGYMVGALAIERGYVVQLIETSPERLRGDALRAREFALSAGIVPQHADQWLRQPELCAQTLVIDALLGIGFAGVVRPLFERLIETINHSSAPVLSVDIPSGLNADTGAMGGNAVRADRTLTFIGAKLGLFTGSGRACAGEIDFDALGIDSSLYNRLVPAANKLSLSKCLQHLPARRMDDHKGKFGSVVVIGGDRGFGGAALMAAQAAARMGAGRVSVVTRAEHIPAFLSRCPELMVIDAANLLVYRQLLSQASVLVVGPGLGTEAWGQRLLLEALDSNKPMVVDADALNLLGTGRFDKYLPRPDWITTPHPGEAARLLSCTTAEVNANRPGALIELRGKLGGVQLLKGSGTLILSDSQNSADDTARNPGQIAMPDVESGVGELSLCAYGNPGMASGGMGDVLAGILGALVAQGMPHLAAANLGSCLHARAADQLAERFGPRGLLAADLIDVARTLLNGEELFKQEEPAKREGS